jgi:hypothetical protein
VVIGCGLCIFDLEFWIMNTIRNTKKQWNTYKQKKTSSLNFVDIDVEAIDTREVLESDDRLEKITDYIIQNHNIKTHNEGNSNVKNFTADIRC